MKRSVYFAVGFPACAIAGLLLVSNLRAQDPTLRPGQTPAQKMDERVAADQNLDRDFLVNQYKDNLCGLEISRHVAANATEPDIKQFAQTMSDAHTQANNKIKDLAAKKNIQLPSQLEDWKRMMIDGLRKKPAADLGRCYVFHAVGFQHICVLEKRFEAAKGTDNDIKQFATEGQTDVAEHLRQAVRLADQLIGARGIMRPVSERG